VLVFVNDVEHAFSFARWHFLRVARESDRLEVVVGQVDVTKSRIGHVLDVRPTNAELTTESVIGPNAGLAVEVDATRHLGNAAEFATVIHAEEKDGRSVVMMVLEGIVQLLVTVVRRAPNSMFDRRPDVLFRVAFDDIKSGVDWVDVIIRGIETSILRRHRRPDARRRSVAIR